MKKIISILLCLALLLGCTAALAEAATAEATTETAAEAAPEAAAEATADKTELKVSEDLTLKAVIPEGYTVTDLTDEDGILFVFLSEDETKPILALGLGVDDSWPAGTKLNNLSEEDLKGIEISKFLAYDEGYEIAYAETAYGTKLLIATDPDKSVVVIYTLYEGYEIEFDLAMANGTPLTQEQIDACVKFLSDLDLVFTAAEAK